MTFLTPLALALLALIPPVIALYLLKLRRQERPVASIYLWQRFVRDLEANAPWQRLRRNLLLLLQILFLLSLILALARPASRTEGVAGRTVVLVFDTSASMAAVDGSPGGVTRLEEARSAARDLVANLPDSARLTLIAGAGGQAVTLISASQDRRQALTALDTLQLTALDSDLGPALALAEAIVAREPEAEIVLLSDGAVEVPALTAPVRHLSFGRADTNQAVSALSLAPAAGEGFTLFVQVSNYSQQPARRRLIVQLDGAPFTAFDLDLPAGGHAEKLMETLPASMETVTAFLEPDQNDLLALDDRAWAVARQGEPARVRLVTPGNAFLQTALGLLGTSRTGPGVELTVVSPEDWKSGRMEEWKDGRDGSMEDGRNGEAGDNTASSNPPTLQPASLNSPVGSTLHIFDTFVPDNLPPGDLLFIAPPASVPGLFEVLGQAEKPAPRPANPDHPLLQNVNLADVQILAAVALAPSDWSRTVIAGENAGEKEIPLLLAGESGSRRVAVLAFDLHQSDLALRPAFPILVANLVGYLAPAAGGRVPAELAPGQALSIAAPAGIEQARLTTPAGQETLQPDERGRVHLPPLAQPGLYRLVFEPAGEGATFAVNFFDPRESAVAPRSDLALPERPGQAAAAPRLPAYREWWRPLAVIALVLLVAEWFVYQRSTLVKYGFEIWQRVGIITKTRRHEGG